MYRTTLDKVICNIPGPSVSLILHKHAWMAFGRRISEDAPLAGLIAEINRSRERREIFFHMLKLRFPSCLAIEKVRWIFIGVDQAALERETKELLESRLPGIEHPREKEAA
jgi:hypothetical protein